MSNNDKKRENISGDVKAEGNKIKGSCLAKPLWMRHKAKHGNEEQIRKACKDF